MAPPVRPPVPPQDLVGYLNRYAVQQPDPNAPVVSTNIADAMVPAPPPAGPRYTAGPIQTVGVDERGNITEPYRPAPTPPPDRVAEGAAILPMGAAGMAMDYLSGRYGPDSTKRVRANPNEIGQPSTEPVLPPGAGAGPAAEAMPAAPGAPQRQVFTPPGMGYIPGSPGRLVEGERQAQRWDTQTQVGKPDDPMAARLREDREGAYTEADIATEEAARIEASADEFRARKGAELQEQLEADARERAAQRKAAETEALTRYDSMQVDPNRVWHNAGTGGTILGFLAMAVGTLGASMSKSPNYTMDMIDKMIERDINAQQSAIAKQGDMVNRMYRRFEREDQETAAMKADRWKAVELDAAKIAQSASDPKIRAQAAKMAGDAAARAAAERQAIADKAADQVTINQTDVRTPDRMVGGTAGRWTGVTQEYAALVENQRSGGMSEEDAQKNAIEILKSRGVPTNAIGEARGVYINSGLSGGDEADPYAGMTPAQRANREEDNSKRIERLAEKEAQIAKAEASLAALEGALLRGQSAGDTPGISRSREAIDRFAPASVRAASSLTMSQEGVQNRMVLDQAFDDYRVATTGAGAGPTELAILRNSFLGDGSPQSILSSVKNARAKLEAQRKAFRAGVGPEAVRTFEERGGTRTDNRPVDAAFKPAGAK